MREGVGFYFSVDDRGEKETALRIHIRRRLSASGRKESRNAHRGRPTVRASQSSPLTQQLSCEQGESRTEDSSGILRHSKIQTTLDLYTQEDSDETRAAQGESPSAVGMHATINELWVGLWIGISGVMSDNSLKRMAGTTRLELATSAVTV